MKLQGNYAMTQRFELQPTLLLFFLHNIAVCHVAKFLENEIYTEKTRKLRQNTQ